LVDIVKPEHRGADPQVRHAEYLICLDDGRNER
jgi:hypothetical protein